VSSHRALDLLRRYPAGQAAALDAHAEGAALHAIEERSECVLELVGERVGREFEGALDGDYTGDHVRPGFGMGTRVENVFQETGHILDLPDADILERGGGEPPQTAKMTQRFAQVASAGHDRDDQVPVLHVAILAERPAIPRGARHLPSSFTSVMP
jgi:hypothetical protein